MWMSSSWRSRGWLPPASRAQELPVLLVSLSPPAVGAELGGDRLLAGIVESEGVERLVPLLFFGVRQTGATPGTIADQIGRIAVVGDRNPILVPGPRPIECAVGALMQNLDRMGDRIGQVEATMLCRFNSPVLAILLAAPLVASRAILPVLEPLLLLARILVVHGPLVPPPLIGRSKASAIHVCRLS